jgi:hypothetical protein
MHIARRFTTAGRDPYESVAFRSATSEIRNPDGSVVFAAEGIEVPAEWSQVNSHVPSVAPMAVLIVARPFCRAARTIASRWSRGKGLCLKIH